MDCTKSMTKIKGLRNMRAHQNSTFNHGGEVMAKEGEGRGATILGLSLGHLHIYSKSFLLVLKSKKREG